MTLPKEIKDQFRPLMKDAVASNWAQNETDFYSGVEDCIIDEFYEQFHPNNFLAAIYYANADVLNEGGFTGLRPLKKSLKFVMDRDYLPEDKTGYSPLSKIPARATHVDDGKWWEVRQLDEVEAERFEKIRVKALERAVKETLDVVKEYIDTYVAPVSTPKVATASGLKEITLSLTDDQLTRLKDVLDV